MEAATQFNSQPSVSEERRHYYAKLAEKNSKPLWEVLSSLVTLVPRDRSQPAVWH